MATADVHLHPVGFGGAPPFRRPRYTYSHQAPMAGRSGPPPSHQPPQSDVDDPNYESKRKKSVNRKTIDYNSSVVRALEVCAVSEGAPRRTQLDHVGMDMIFV